MVIARLDIHFSWQSTLILSFTCEARLTPVTSSAVGLTALILLLKRDLICMNKLISKRSQELYNSMCFAFIQSSNLTSYFKVEALSGKNLSKKFKAYNEYSNQNVITYLWVSHTVKEEYYEPLLNGNFRNPINAFSRFKVLPYKLP